MSIKTLYQRFRAWQKEPFKFEIEHGKVHHCANCGTDYEGEYCPACGQEEYYGPMSWLAIKQDIQRLLGPMEPDSTVSFILQIFGRPGYLIGDYLNGRRRICCSPMAALSVFALAAAYVFSITGKPNEVWAQALAEKGGLLGIVVEWLSSNVNWVILLQTFLLLIPTWLLFRYAPKHTRHDLPQGIYIQVFMASLVLTAAMLRTLVGTWVLSVVPLYYLIAYYQLFGYGLWGTIWRTLLCLGSVMCFFGVITMVVMYLAGMLSPARYSGNVMGLAAGLLLLIVGTVWLGWWISKKQQRQG